jgi:hypothetical protein
MRLSSCSLEIDSKKLLTDSEVVTRADFHVATNADECSIRRAKIDEREDGLAGLEWAAWCDARAIAQLHTDGRVAPR